MIVLPFARKHCQTLRESSAYGFQTCTILYSNFIASDVFDVSSVKKNCYILAFLGNAKQAQILKGFEFKLIFWAV